MKKPNLLRLVFLFTITVLSLCIVTGCGAHKKTLHSKKQANITVDALKNSVTNTEVNTNLEKETTRYGDTLQGNFPLPILTDKPVIVTAVSGGQKLKISITKNALKYQSIPKPISTTKVKEVQKVTQQQKVAEKETKKTERKEEVSTTDERKQWKLPLWLILTIGILLLLLATYFLKPIKNLLKPFKT